jgi:hypothetical protein
MSEMVERVARALCADALADMPPILDYSTADFAAAKAAVVDERWVEFTHESRIAIEAMREPTEAMIRAGGNKVSGTPGYFLPDDYVEEATEIYQAMIDAALEE